MRIAHGLVSLVVAAAVPAAIYLSNGTLGLEFIALGAGLGLAYWY
ncbi:hypothetical protein [Rhizobium sp. YS-1r]|nr:hypothetical protein [Rhizobium sp. YS-1r]